jgi:hypothetical protein
VVCFGSSSFRDSGACGFAALRLWFRGSWPIWLAQETKARPNPFQQLFTAVAEVCGLKDKMAATGYELPDVSDDDDSDDEEGQS